MSEMSLIAAVESAGDDQLQEIDIRLQQLEADLGAVQSKIASLKALREVINIRLHGPPPKKEHWSKRRKTEAEPVPAPVEHVASNGSDAADGPLLRDRILALLNRTGPLDVMGICRRLHEEESSINRSVGRAANHLRTLADGRIAPADWKDVGEG